MEKPECYGTHEKGHVECENCAVVEECKRYTGRLRSKNGTAGLSRKRAMTAFCWECNGGTSHAPDCMDAACPLYPFRKKSKQKPKLWWMEPSKTWNEGSQKARGVKKILPSVDGEEEDG